MSHPLASDSFSRAAGTPSQQGCAVILSSGRRGARLVHISLEEVGTGSTLDGAGAGAGAGGGE